MYKALKTVFNSWQTNLTLRYVVGLSLIALFAISSQLLIQDEMSKQKRDQEIMRLLSDLKRHSRDLRQSLVGFQLQGRPYELKSFENQVFPFFQTIESLHGSQLSDSEASKRTIFSLEPLGHVEEDFNRLKQVMSSIMLGLSVAQVERAVSLDSQLKAFLDLEIVYNEGLSVAKDNYEAAAEARLSQLRFLEVLFLVMTLLVLFFEALFIFRPAVQRLNEALQVRSDFISRISHEIRNPLNSILGMTKLLEGMVQSPEEIRLISKMHRSGKTLLSVLENILEFSKLGGERQKPKLDRTSILKIVERSLELISPQLGSKALNCCVYLDARIPARVRMDYVKTEQIIFNLLNNAVKFTEKGYVGLSVVLVGKEKELKLRISIEDTGPGIPDSKKVSVFNAFTQGDESTRRRHGGVGLGLAIVQQLTNVLDGDVRIDLSYKAGARFIVDLPVEKVGGETIEQSFALTSIQGLSVLVYSSDPVYLKCLKEMFSLFPIKLHLASSLEDLSRLSNETFDRCIIDLDSKVIEKVHLLKNLSSNEKKAESLFLVFEKDFEDLLKNESFSLKEHVFLKPLLPSDVKRFFKSGHDVDRKHDSVSIKSSLKIVVLDDDQNNLDIIEGFLRHQCDTLSFFTAASEALEFMKANDFDLLITDMEMPDQSGFDVAKELRDWERRSSSKHHLIFAASAYQKNELQMNPDWKFFDDIVEKPIYRDQLLVKLEVVNRKLGRVASKRVEGVEPHLTHLVPQYIERKKAALEEIAGEGEIDMAQAVRFGHQLKGTAKSYGLAELGRLGGDLELEAKESRQKNVKKILEKMKKLFDQLEF